VCLFPASFLPRSQFLVRFGCNHGFLRYSIGPTLVVSPGKKILPTGCVKIVRPEVGVQRKRDPRSATMGGGLVCAEARGRRGPEIGEELAG